MSLEPDLIRKGKACAERQGLKSFSALVRILVVEYLKKTGDALRESGERDLEIADQAKEIGDELIRKSGVKKDGGRAR